MNGKEINQAVRELLDKRRLTLRDVANILGVSPSSISNQLTSDKPFGRLMAKRWGAALGLNVEFLITGEGNIELEQKIEDRQVPAPPVSDGSIVVPAEFARMVTDLAEVLRLQQQEIAELRGFAPPAHDRAASGTFRK